MKAKIIKAQTWNWHWKLYDHGVLVGEKVCLSLPYKKGRRKLHRGKVEYRSSGCDCCAGLLSIVKSDGTIVLSVHTNLVKVLLR